MHASSMTTTMQNTTNVTRAELDEVLRLHRLWLYGAEGGVRADLADADLAGADLRRAGLDGADLTGANLTGAKLTSAKLASAKLPGADLTGADLAGARLADAVLCRAILADADLTDASLHRVDLTCAILRRADLTCAGLTGAILRRADLTGAELDGARLTGAVLVGAVLTGVPVVPGLHVRVADAVSDPARLRMDTWHTCWSTHCRAGWAIHLAGAAGYALGELVGSETAGALIYAASTGDPVPDFYASDVEALADIRACAERVRS
jgi:hypothetical protein